MHPFTQTNRQWQAVQPPHRSYQDASQLTYNPVWKEQPGMADTSHHQNTTDKSIQPQQMLCFNFQERLYPKKQIAYWQTSTVNHQAVSSQQLTARETRNIKVIHGNVANLFLNLPTGYPNNKNGLQAATQQEFGSNSAVIHPSSHFASNIHPFPAAVSAVAGHGELEPIPAGIGREAGYTPGTTPVCRGATQPRTHTLTPTGNLGLANQPDWLDSNPEPPCSEATALPTAPQCHQPTSNMIKANSIYPQQHMTEPRNQQSEDRGKQRLQMHVDNVNKPTTYRLLKHLLQNNETDVVPFVACTTTATSLPQKQKTCISNSVSTFTHNRQISHNQYYKQNDPHHALIPRLPPPYVVVVPQSKENEFITPNSLKEQISPASTVSQKHQQEIPLNSPLSDKTAYHIMPKTNGYVNTQEQTRRYQINERSGHLLMPCSSTSQGYLLMNNNSPYREQQFVSKVLMTDLNQNKQHVKLSVTTNSNLSVPQTPRLNSGASTHSFQSRTQYGFSTSEQKAIPNVTCDVLAQDGCGERRQSNGNGNDTTSAGFIQNCNVSRRNMIGSVNEASQSMKWPEKISLQTSKTKSSVEKDLEMLERIKRISVSIANENSMQSSPGGTGLRAVAVVPPLSQETNQVVRNDAASELIDKNMSMPSKTSSSGTDMLPPDASGHQFSAKQSIDMQVDQNCAPTIQQLVSTKEAVNQNGDKDNDVDQSDPKSFPNLSSVPTIPWTIEELTKVIQDEEKAQMKLRDSAMPDSRHMLSILFWEGQVQNLIKSLKNRWYSMLIHDVKKFCSKYITLDSVILTQVKTGFERQPQSYHILRDNEVYSEQPYKSLWLNVNEQVDDFEKEFGLPWSLKHHMDMSSCQKQPDQDCKASDSPAKIVSEMSKDVQSQSNLELVESSVESLQNSTDEDAKAQSPSPVEMESDDSRDSFCSFAIKVLPPEEAKVIFEQLQCNTTHQPGVVINNPKDDEPCETINATQNDRELEKEHVLEEICCIQRWMQLNCGLDMPSLSICHCRSKESLTSLHDIDEKEEMVGQQEDELIPSSKVHVEEKNQENVTQTSIITENSHKYHTHSDKEAKDTSQIRLDYNQLSIALTNDKEDKGHFSNNTENQFDPEMESKGHPSVSSEKATEIFPRSGSEVVNKTSHPAKRSGQPHFTLTDVETEEQHPQITAAFSLSGNHEGVDIKRRKLSSSESNSPFDVDPENEILSSNVKKVQLVLFGSMPQQTCSLTDDGKGQNSSTRTEGLLMPPEVLSVNVSTLKEKSSANIPKGKNSIKQSIYEQWQRLFHPIKSSHRRKLKTQKHTGSWSVKRSGNCRLSLKRKRLLSGKLKGGEQIKMPEAIIVKQPLDLKRTDGKNESHSDIPLQENVLKFNVLPNTYCFSDSCNENKDASDPIPHKAVLHKEKHKGFRKTTARVKDSWLPVKSDTCCPQSKTPVSKTSGVFHDFQKKYKEKTQTFIE